MTERPKRARTVHFVRVTMTEKTERSLDLGHSCMTSVR